MLSAMWELYWTCGVTLWSLQVVENQIYWWSGTQLVGGHPTLSAVGTKLVGDGYPTF
jgi:hypothetical protein